MKTLAEIVSRLRGGGIIVSSKSARAGHGFSRSPDVQEPGFALLIFCDTVRVLLVPVCAK
jgi:hypothetical protein